MKEERERRLFHQQLSFGIANNDHLCKKASEEIFLLMELVHFCKLVQFQKISNVLYESASLISGKKCYKPFEKYFKILKCIYCFPRKMHTSNKVCRITCQLAKIEIIFF